MSYKSGQKVQKVMMQPIKSRVQVWLYDNTDDRIEGCIIGFDEYMNLVLDEAEELNIKTNSRKPLGRILLKGENITLFMSVEEAGRESAEIS